MPAADEIRARIEIADAVAALASSPPVTDPFTRLLGRMVAAELISDDDAVRMLDAAEKRVAMHAAT